MTLETAPARTCEDVALFRVNSVYKTAGFHMYCGSQSQCGSFNYDGIVPVGDWPATVFGLSSVMYKDEAAVGTGVTDFGYISKFSQVTRVNNYVGRSVRPSDAMFSCTLTYL